MTFEKPRLELESRSWEKKKQTVEVRVDSSQLQALSHHGRRASVLALRMPHRDRDDHQDPCLARFVALPVGPLHHDLDSSIGDERLAANHMIKRGCGLPAQPARTCSRRKASSESVG
jgi:hypothetical protein